jgi:Domain of unknown function (DUF4417)
MLTQLPSPQETPRNLRRERRLWHDGTRHTPSMGCAKCPDQEICGGLQVGDALFDCLGFCCHNSADCDTVCRNKPEEFVQRVREVGGFAFDNVPRASLVTAPALPALVPLLYHKSGRSVPFRARAVCLPLYSVIRRQNGEPRYTSAAELADGFSIARNVPVILTGTAKDRPLERWWSLGEQRREVIRALRGLNIALVTTPNFSLFIDQPRWDDLHSQKRILIVHEEFLREGLPAALHVNARTDRDWERWRDYIAARPEVTHIAFEFATGAGWASRTAWHSDHLVRLAAAVGRPLHLIVRGGGKFLPTLAAAFADITLLETSVFMKTNARQRAVLSGPGKVNWRSSPTKKTETIDNLLMENWDVVAAAHLGGLNQRVLPLQGGQ